jgi:hypothetical protein
MDRPRVVPQNNWRPEMIRGLLPDNMYEYVKKAYDWFEPNIVPYVMNLTLFEKKLTAEGQRLFDSYFDLQEFTPNNLQQFFVKLSEKIPSGHYEGKIRETQPDDPEPCPSFEVLADAIVDVLDDVLHEWLEFPNQPPRDHPFWQGDTQDLTLLGNEYGEFRQSTVDARVAFRFQAILHPTKQGPALKYTFKGDMIPSQKRRMEKWEETRPKRMPPPQRYR